MSNTRQHAHELIDLMPEAQLSALVGLLETNRCCDPKSDSSITRALPLRTSSRISDLRWSRSATTRNRLETARAT